MFRKSGNKHLLQLTLSREPRGGTALLLSQHVVHSKSRSTSKDSYTPSHICSNLGLRIAVSVHRFHGAASGTAH